MYRVDEAVQYSWVRRSTVIVNVIVGRQPARAIIAAQLHTMASEMRVPTDTVTSMASNPRRCSKRTAATATMSAFLSAHCAGDR